MLEDTHFTLEQIVESLNELEFKPTRDKHRFGLYCPDLYEVRFSLYMNASADEFVMTILHELVHHMDDDMKFDETETERLAELLYDDPKINNYMRGYFSSEISMYWPVR